MDEVRCAFEEFDDPYVREPGDAVGREIARVEAKFL